MTLSKNYCQLYSRISHIRDKFNNFKISEETCSFVEPVYFYELTDTDFKLYKNKELIFHYENVNLVVDNTVQDDIIYIESLFKEFDWYVFL